MKKPETTSDQFEFLKTGAQSCFQSAFDAHLLIICLDDRRPNDPDTHTFTSALFIDGHSSPPAITLLDREDDLKTLPPIDCTWIAGLQTLKRIFDGDRQLTNAFMSGRLKIHGNMAVMARLDLTSRLPGVATKT